MRFLLDTENHVALAHWSLRVRPICITPDRPLEVF